MINIKYTLANQEYNIDYTMDQIKKDLVWYGVPNVNKMNDKELIQALKEINNN